jgi:hypothetical protein
MSTTANPASRRRTWIIVAVSVLLACVLLFVAAIGTGIVLFRRHVHSQIATSDAASDQIARTRARFADQRPLVEIAEDDRVVLHRKPDAPKRPIAMLRILAYNEDDGRLVAVDVPNWLLRLMPSGGDSGFRLDGAEDFGGSGLRLRLDSPEDRLTLEDLERFGPGLILDVRRHGGQVLVWTE